MRCQCGARPLRIGIMLLTAIVLLAAALAEPVNGQAVQQQRVFTVGITRKDGSILPLLLAQRVTPLRIVSVTPETGLLALSVNDIDLLYTDGASALLGAIKGTDLVFIAGGLDYVTGSFFASPNITGFSDPRVVQRASGIAISFQPPRAEGAVTFEVLALRAILRQQKISRVFPVFHASPTSKEATLQDPLIRDLSNGRIDFAYVSAELDPVVSAARLRRLNFEPVPLQGVVIAARRSRAELSRAQFQDFLRAFVAGIRTFLDPKGVPAVMAILRSSIGLDEASAEHVFVIFRDTKAFKDPPVPSRASVSNLIKELSIAIPEAKKLSAQRLINDELLGSLRK